MNDIIKKVYQLLKDRDIHPTGKFDSGGRWYAANSDLINVRSPSRSFPYSEMSACRARKYVKACAEKFDCKTEAELIAVV